jgi:hypothetical protein
LVLEGSTDSSVAEPNLCCFLVTTMAERPWYSWLYEKGIFRTNLNSYVVSMEHNNNWSPLGALS